ncbi:MAG: division/cell wall cluster transcriptional repressor MraZ [Anaerolineae bacterium]|nr:division/cell wall cluster transcriptional repressor MraZ [Anaerolineae bacterium]MDW8173506.1 division/cell wall cluster transcriptional repressor MraZ [Anaerolineae bacterium]
MFWGEYTHHLDSKGRVIVPARFRPHLEGAVLTRGLDQNLVLYSRETWRSVLGQLNQIPITNPTARALRRLLFSGAVEVQIDKQGRLLIPSHLREYAQLSDQALMVGMETFIEVWQPSQWQATLDGLAEQLANSAHLLKLEL